MFTSKESLITKNAELFGSVRNFQTLGMDLDWASSMSTMFGRMSCSSITVETSLFDERSDPFEITPEKKLLYYFFGLKISFCIVVLVKIAFVFFNITFT